MPVVDGNWLRAATRSLRANQPSLYARLNRVRNRILSRGSGLAAYQAKSLRRFRSLCLAHRPADSRVLEIGSDVEGRVLRMLASWGVKEAVGVNPVDEIWSGVAENSIQLAPRARLERADARDLPFDDGSFDFIFSVATFEHILELPRALKEMRRVLRRGGVLYSNYGPIWSGCRGHHLRVAIDGTEYRHFNPASNPIPDFAHLLCGEEALRDALTPMVAASHADAIVHWLFHDDGINRLFHHEYMACFEGSGLRLESSRAERDPVDEQLLRVLRFRYPTEDSFDITNNEVVLVRDD